MQSPCLRLLKGEKSWCLFWPNGSSNCKSDGIFDVKRIILTKDGRSIGGWAGNPTRYGLPSVARSGPTSYVERAMSKVGVLTMA